MPKIINLTELPLSIHLSKSPNPPHVSIFPPILVMLTFFFYNLAVGVVEAVVD